MGSTILQGDWKSHEGHSMIKDAPSDLEDDPMERNNVWVNYP